MHSRQQILLCRREIYLGVNNNFECVLQWLKMKNTDLELTSNIALLVGEDALSVQTLAAECVPP